MMSRMYSKWTILTLLSASLSVTGCSTKESSGRDVELLTGNPWKYERAGFDSDDDGIFDALDTLIAGGEKDNTIIFRKDGTGYTQAGGVRYKTTGPDSLPFMWAFQNNDSTIYFQDQYYRVRSLTRNRFEIYADQKFGAVSTRYIIVFRH
jgi:predicted small secreted protein